MAKVFLSDLFGELFTKKTCIYLSHNYETFNENCVVWETKYSFRKEVYSSRGMLKLESSPDDENAGDTDVKEEVNKNIELKQSPAIEKLRPVVKPKKDEYIKGSVGNKAMMKSKMRSGRSTGQYNVKSFKNSDKSKMLAGSAAQMNFSSVNTNRNNTKRNDSVNMKKHSDKNWTSAGQFSNVDNKITSGRNVSQLNANNVNNSSKSYLKSSNMKLDKGDKNSSGRRAGPDAVISNENRKTTNKTSVAEGLFSQGETINVRNRTGNMDAARIGGASHAQKNNFDQIAGGDHSQATSKMTRTTSRQDSSIENKNAGTAFGDSINLNSFPHLLSNAYNNEQTAAGDTVRNIYGIYLPSESGVRSSFPSSCNRTNLVYDERPKTLNFGSQCTDKSFFQDDNTISVSDNKTASKSSQTEQGIFILKITTGRQN